MMNRDIETWPSSASVCFFQAFRATLRAEQPDVDPDPVLHELRAFAAWRGTDLPLPVPPTRQEMEDYLAECSTQHGGQLAALKLHRVQTAAPILWGMPYASLIAIVRRQRQRAAKPNRKSKTDSIRALIARLPEEWQPGLVARMRSEPGNRKLKWSADHLDRKSVV